MNGEMVIKNMEGLVSSVLTDGKKLISYDHERLLATGENYGSTILKLKLYLRGIKGEEIVSCVVKLVPPSPYIWKMFNIPVTYKKEIGMYKVIGPTLNNFGKERGIENLFPMLPEYVGGRLSLDPESDEVDHDAALVLKNMLVDGYVVGDRFTGFDKDTMTLLLKGLATFHASAIALKLTEPEVFNKNIFSIIESKIPFDINEEVVTKLGEQIKDGLSRNEKCIPLVDKVLKVVAGVEKLMAPSKPREPFASLVHHDLWVNNMMVKYKNGKPVSTKFVDFQMIEYDNPANDVLFLIYSSARLDLFEEVDTFLSNYFDQFINVLRELRCDTTLFSKEAFLKEVATAAPREMVHTLFMLKPLYTKKGKVKELSDMKGDDDIFGGHSDLHENYYPRLQSIAQDFIKREWV